MQEPEAINFVNSLRKYMDGDRGIPQNRFIQTPDVADSLRGLH